MHQREKTTINSRLSGTSSRAIKRLSDFKPSHNVPKEVNNATRRFAKACATKDIQLELEKIWSLCREEFQYKRKDKNGPVIEAGCGSIKFPDFKFTITAEQDEENPEFVVWKWQVDEIPNLAFLLSRPFNQVFTGIFDTLEAEFTEPQNIEEIIDRIEELDSKAITVDYPVDCSFCEIFIRSLGISIHLTNNSYRFKLPDCPNPQSLVEKIMEIQKSIHSFSPENPLVDLA